MANQERQPNLSEPSAQAKRDEFEQDERQELREQASQADTTIRPVSPASRGRRPLFRV